MIDVLILMTEYGKTYYCQTAAELAIFAENMKNSKKLGGFSISVGKLSKEAYEATQIKDKAMFIKKEQ